MTRELFERNALRAVIAGAIAGALHHLAALVTPETPGAWVILAATVAAVACGTPRQTLALRWLGVTSPAIPWVMGLPDPWALALGAGAAGTLMVAAVRLALGEPLFRWRVSGALAVASVVALTLAGDAVVTALGASLAQTWVPGVANAGASGAALALFAFAGSWPAHVASGPDVTLTRAKDQVDALTGELRALAERALVLYECCARELALLPRAARRGEFARMLRQMAAGAVDLATAWTRLERELGASGRDALAAQIDGAEARALATCDPLAARQLQAAARALRDEQAVIERLSQRRDRVVARLTEHLAVLEHARVALLALRGGQVQIRAAELAALSRRFHALARAPRDDGDMADEVATAAAIADEEVRAVVTRRA